MIESVDFKVSVRCMTYNQASYIEDAMNGFCMQQTEFPFVCIVMDDASTDNEQVIINKYLESHFDLEEERDVQKEETNDYILIIARHKKNKNCFFAVFFLKYNHYGNRELNNRKLSYYSKLESKVDYIAYCEGDDYWIDTQKLQKQYNAMEQKKDCSICFHRVQAVSSNKKNLPLKVPKEQWDERLINMEEHLHEQFHHDFCFSTSCFFVKRNVMDEYARMRADVYKSFPFGDLPIIWTALLKAPGFYLPEICSCYRRFSGGYTSQVVKDSTHAINLNNRVIASYRAFDEYTDYKYHDEFYYSIAKHELNIISLKRELFKILKKKYIAVFKDRGLRFSVLYLWSFFPFHFNMTEKCNKIRGYLPLGKN